MTEDWPHIGDSNCWSRLEIRWRRIPCHVEIEVELINFFKSKPKPFKTSAYHDFAAIALKDIPPLGLEKGDIFCLTFPWLTLNNGISPLPIHIRRSIKRDMGNDNIYLKFTKKNREFLIIHKLERREEDPEMTKKDDELVYNFKPDYPSRKKKENEKPNT